MLQTIKTKTHKALTLIEALLFLGIAAVVIVGAVVFYNNASGSANVNAAITQIQAISTGVRGLYSGQSTYGGNAAGTGAASNLTSLVINAGIAPSGAIANDELRNPWGGSTTLTARERFFTIQMGNVPRDSCVRLLSSGMMGDGSIVAMHAVASATDPTAGNANNPQFHVPNSGVQGAGAAGNPVTVAEVNTTCSQGSNVLTFWVR